MSLIGLLTATEKQVHLGRLHMRPIQWHLKNNWRVPESLEKVIPIPRSLHSHLQWWLQEDNVLTGQPLHPIKHALQIFTDASKEGWGTHLNERTARGAWSLPESKLHINYLEHPNRVVSPSRGLPSNMQQVAPASSRPICHKVQQQVTSFCVTCTGSPGHSSGCAQSAMGRSGRICLPTSSHIGQSGEVAGHPHARESF